MLLNSVILFIRDMLPIFYLLSLLLCLVSHSYKWLAQGTVVGIVGSILLYIGITTVSNAFEGAGLELIKTALNFCLLFAVCYLVSTFHSASLDDAPFHWTLVAIVALIVIPNAISFSIYANGYWSVQGPGMSLFTGAIIGLGMSLSIASLSFLGFSSLHKAKIVIYALVVFTAGQVAHSATLLEQINWLPDDQKVWNTQQFVSDDSEYGHLIHTLFGYESTPSYSYIAFYVFALLCPFLWSWSRRYWLPEQSKTLEKIHEQN